MVQVSARVDVRQAYVEAVGNQNWEQFPTLQLDDGETIGVGVLYRDSEIVWNLDTIERGRLIRPRFLCHVFLPQRVLVFYDYGRVIRGEHWQVSSEGVLGSWSTVNNGDLREGSTGPACHVCTDRLAVMCAIPCMHLSMCRSCLTRLNHTRVKPPCIVCRKPTSSYKKIFYN